MRVPCDQLEPGMEVAADVLNLNQVLLIPRGTVLTERHLRLLRMWGIGSVNIAGSDTPGAECGQETGYTPELLAEAEKRVSYRFKHVTGDGPEIQIIRQLAVERTAARLRSSLGRNPPPRG